MQVEQAEGMLSPTIPVDGTNASSVMAVPPVMLAAPRYMNSHAHARVSQVLSSTGHVIIFVRSFSFSLLLLTGFSPACYQPSDYGRVWTSPNGYPIRVRLE